MKTNLLLVFCKNPQKGKVKTRLAKSIGDDKALIIYEKLLDKTAAVLNKLHCDIAVYYSENIPEQDKFKFLKTTRKKQVGDDLGTRMANAFIEGLKTHQKVVIIGTDLWTLESKDIEKAFAALNQNTAVLGPAQDGGYYLLGLRHFIPRLFANKAWGTGEVLENTKNDLQGEKVYLLDEKNDIDTYEDLQQHPDLAACIQKNNS